MEIDKNFEFLLELAQESTKELLKIYHKKGDRYTSLIFPNKRDGNLRISEQELRFVLTAINDKIFNNYYSFSVETPTEIEYTFSGIKKRSASTDLTFYLHNKKVINIELKAHNPSIKSITKDIEKLVTEPFNGAWIHILENEDSGTIKTIFKKFRQSIKMFQPPKHPISFHILILKTGTLISRKGKDNDLVKTNLCDVFNIDYSGWKDLLPGKHQFSNGTLLDDDSTDEVDWQVDKFDINAL